uniref:Transmembrane protein n=1 Tax=Leishmania guyanensis TaxID=5670 RepID=A0A1E1IQ23_LEIGU
MTCSRAPIHQTAKLPGPVFRQHFGCAMALFFSFLFVWRGCVLAAKRMEKMEQHREKKRVRRGAASRRRWRG